MKEKQTKKIWVLLTQHNDRLSKVIRFISNNEYSHVSIALEDDAEHFFTFKKNPGFCVERPLKIYTERKRSRHCRLYSIDVEPEVYERAKSLLSEFELNKNTYKYNFLGLILCFLKMSWNQNRRYFCSQFVAEMLSTSGAVQFHKDPSLYLPKDFIGVDNLTLRFSGTLGELSVNAF